MGNSLPLQANIKRRHRNGALADTASFQCNEHVAIDLRQPLYPVAGLLISEAYREQNRMLHAIRDDYGRGGVRWASFVSKLLDDNTLATVLDYGCGKGTLAAALPSVAIAEYDPAISGKDGEPTPADLVVCTDVLEHIEPEHLTDVLRHIKSLTKRIFLFKIATRRARKHLPDGRNAHLIIRDARWWKARLSEDFNITSWNDQRGDGLVHGLAVPSGLSHEP